LKKKLPNKNVSQNEGGKDRGTTRGKLAPTLLTEDDKTVDVTAEAECTVKTTSDRTGLKKIKTGPAH
jgi:hypothetical protein